MFVKWAPYDWIWSQKPNMGNKVIPKALFHGICEPLCRSYISLSWTCQTLCDPSHSCKNFAAHSGLTAFSFSRFTMTSSNGDIFRVTGPLWGYSTGHWWILLTMPSNAGLCFRQSSTKKKHLSKKSRRWWFETLWRSLWRHCNGKSPNLPWLYGNRITTSQVDCRNLDKLHKSIS